MAIRSFNVGGRKSLVSARYESLPDLVFVTGPNGAGKSSLLTLMKDQGTRDEGTKVLHIGPHRPWRKGNLLKASTLGLPMSFGDMLTSPNLPHFEGAVPYSMQQFQGQFRDPDASDEAQALVKVSFAAISERYRDRLQELHQLYGSVRKGQIPDPYGPLRELLKRLLPHLLFDNIDETQKNNVRILFRSVYQTSGVPFDIDDLSSGEKAVLTLFLPVIEYQIDKILGKVALESKRTFLIDEPELHLHPALQADMVAYFRHLAKSDSIQFIVATHSPTMIDAAQEDELFIVMPWQSASDGNQFSKLADNAERLLLIKELLGSAYVYSRGRPVLFIEGEFPDDTSKHTDFGLLELILPDFRGYAFVPSKGKSQAITGADRLRRAAADQEHAITAYALVDADYDQKRSPWVFPWPVCMIENLLLDAVSISTVLQPYVAQGALAGAESVRQALTEVARDLRDDEIRRRLKAIAGTGTIRADVVVEGGSVSIEVAAEDFEQKALRMRARAEAAIETVKTTVENELTDGTALHKFSGKNILGLFFDKHVQRFFPKLTNFTFSLAQQVVISGYARDIVSETVRRIEAYFPPDLPDILSRNDLIETGNAAGINMNGLIDWANWKVDNFNGAVRDAMVGDHHERDLVKLLTQLRATGNFAAHRELRPLVSDILAR